MYEISFLQYKDIDNLVNMNIEEEYAYDKDLIIYLTQDESTVFTIVKNLKRDIVGLITTSLLKKTIYIKDIIVDIRYRRKGIGSRLLREYRNKVNGLSIKRIVVDVNEYNLRAQMFFRYNRFICTEILDNHSSNYEYNEETKRIQHIYCASYKMVYTQ